MSQCAPIIRELLEKNYSEPLKVSSMVLDSLSCQFLSLPTKTRLEMYQNLKTLTFTHCDLRNLENFPRLPQLTDLDLSFNSLMGTFNFLMPLNNLQYLNLCSNLVSEVIRLLPLKKLGGLSICLKDNPLIATDGWKTKMKSYHLQLMKEPKQINNVLKQIKGTECKLEDAKNLNGQQAKAPEPVIKQLKKQSFSPVLQQSNQRIFIPPIFNRNINRLSNYLNNGSRRSEQFNDFSRDQSINELRKHLSKQSSENGIYKIMDFNFNSVQMNQLEQISRHVDIKHISSQQLDDSEQNLKQQEEQQMGSEQRQKTRLVRLTLIDYDDSEEEDEEKELGSQESQPNL